MAGSGDHGCILRIRIFPKKIMIFCDEIGYIRFRS
jgi:hypothetical protein